MRSKRGCGCQLRGGASRTTGREGLEKFKIFQRGEKNQTRLAVNHKNFGAKRTKSSAM
jgi:hypothetical protein